jgi:hypothetical protein
LLGLETNALLTSLRIARVIFNCEIYSTFQGAARWDAEAEWNRGRVEDHRDAECGDGIGELKWKFVVVLKIVQEHPVS